MQNPELQLARLSSAIDRLLVASAIIPDEEFDIALLLSIARRLHLSKVLNGQLTVAVAGLQGVGKSTLVKMLYDLPEGILPSDIGRGEKLPIRFIEHAGSDYQATLLSFRRDDARKLHLDEDIIPLKDIADYLSSGDPNHVMIDLKVPRCHFYERDLCLLLLPGKEEGQEAWNHYAQYALRLADGCIFVLNETRLAQGNNREMLEQVLNDFGTARPVLAITGSDQSSDGNAEVAQQLREQLGITGEHEAGRVVCTGTDPDTKSEWTSKLVEAVNLSTRDTRSHRQLQLDEIKRLVLDTEKAMRSLGLANEASLRAYESDDSRHVQSVLKRFDRAQQKLSERYKKALQDAVAKRINSANRQFEPMVVEDGFWKKIKRRWFRSTKDELEFRDVIEGCWEADVLEVEHQKTLATAVSGQFKLRLPLEESEEDSGEHSKALEVYVEQANHTGDVISPVMARDLAVLTTGRGEVSDEFSKAVATIPALALEYIRLARHDRALIPGFVNGHEANDGKDRMQKLAGNLGEASKAQRQLIKGIAGIVVADAAMDGDIDTIPNLAKAMGLANVSVAGVSMVSIATAVVSAGVLGVMVLREASRADLEKLERGRRAFQSLGEVVEQRYIQQFDDLMYQMRIFIHDRLRERHNLDKSWNRSQQLSVAIADVKEIAITIRQSIRIDDAAMV
jgi:hypothetical protein